MILFFINIIGRTPEEIEHKKAPGLNSKFEIEVLCTWIYSLDQTWPLLTQVVRVLGRTNSMTVICDDLWIIQILIYFCLNISKNPICNFWLNIKNTKSSRLPLEVWLNTLLQKCVLCSRVSDGEWATEIYFKCSLQFILNTTIIYT